MTTSQQLSSQPFKWRYAEFNDSDFQISRQTTLFFIATLVSVVLTVVVVFMNARWIYHSITANSPPAASTSASGLGIRRRRGLDPTTINNIPIVLYGNSAARGGAGELGEQSAAECSICLGIFGDKEKVKVLPECSHCFHPECVDKWLMAHASCPLCRAIPRVDSPV